MSDLLRRAGECARMVRASMITTVDVAAALRGFPQSAPRSKYAFRYPQDDGTLRGLVNLWENRARRAFGDAEGEPTDEGRRFIEHGAIGYLNCARELRDLIGGVQPTSERPERGRD